MFKMFHLDFSKVNLGVAHVAMAIHACFKCFIFQTYVANASSGCCNSRSGVAQLLWLYTHVSSVSSVLDVC
jgi:hypothetical protein